MTEINASDTVGICTRCDDKRGPGCERDDVQLECDVGACFGADTQGGGTGHCDLDPPPSYQCLADCRERFNDDDAWCYVQGLVGREHACVQECGYIENVLVTCQDVGYPGRFECNGARCEVP